MAKPVFLIPGFTASDLFVQSTGAQIWFNTSLAAVLTLDGLRLAPDGVSPGSPGGVPCGIILNNPQKPWGLIATLLASQLGADEWTVQAFSYDWRLDLMTPANALAADIEASVSPGAPATLVCHSAGGLVGLLAYARLVADGKANLVRRIITIGTPFYGSYGTVQWLTADSPQMKQLLSYGGAMQYLTGFSPASWTARHLLNLALTWPSFYELFPALFGPEYEDDPFRVALYSAANYPAGLNLSQAWLDYSRSTWWPAINAAQSLPPNNVLTVVSGTSLRTPWDLLTARTPLEVGQLGYTVAGDGTVTVQSSQLDNGKPYFVPGEHASLPLGLTTSGLLALLIQDDRGPVPPPVPVTIEAAPIQANVTYPPEADYLNKLLCIGGG